jgi:hypothetical protein
MRTATTVPNSVLVGGGNDLVTILDDDLNF